MRTLLIILSLLSTVSFGQTNSKIKVHYNTNDLVLEASSCEPLNKVSKALNHWEERLKEKITTTPKCVCQNNTCKINISNNGPQLLQNYHGVVPKNVGPNCFNAALVGAGILKSIRHTSPWELKEWMSEKFCRLRSPDETKKPGDIVRIRDAKTNNRDVHTFTYLTEDLVFTKNGDGYYEPTYPYLLMDPNQMYESKGFYTAKKCQNVTKEEAKKKGCQHFTEYYECKTLEEYYADTKETQLLQEFKRQQDELNSYECSMENETVFVKGLNDIKKDLMISISAVNMLAQRKKFDDDKENDELWWIIEKQTESLQLQNSALRKKSKK